MFIIDGLKGRHLLLVALLFSSTVMKISCAQGDVPPPTTTAPGTGADGQFRPELVMLTPTADKQHSKAVEHKPVPTEASIIKDIKESIDSLSKEGTPGAELQVKELQKTLEKLEGVKKVAGFHPVTPAPAGKATDRAEKVHVIIAADTREKTVSGTVNKMKDGATANAVMMKNLLCHELGNQVDQHKKPVKVIHTQEFCHSWFDHERIMTAINGLQTSKSGNDTIFVYIACQAGPDQNSLLVPYSGRSDGVVSRKTYLDCMRKKSARQIVLVTDTWGSTPVANYTENAADQVLPTTHQTPTHLLSALLLYQRGVYDFGGSRPPVSSGDPGEVCVWYHDGGLFTHAFFDASLYCQDTREGWASLFQDAAHRMPKGMITFQGGTTQQGQHPHVFSVR